MKEICLLNFRVLRKKMLVLTVLPNVLYGAVQVS